MKLEIKQSKTVTLMGIGLTACITVSDARPPRAIARSDLPVISPEELRGAFSPRQMTRRNEVERPGVPTDETASSILLPEEVRTVDGSDNNFDQPNWGAAGQSAIRLLPNAYADGSGSPAGQGRPSARLISNVLASQSGSIFNSRGATDFLWQWGQFIDHDMIETPGIDPPESFAITVPAGDPFFDPTSTGTSEISLNRSLYEVVDGVREQVNAISAFIDGSQIYGSDDERAFALRRLDGSGKLKVTSTDQGDLLPYNEDALPNVPTNGNVFFLAGDVRANEQVGLTAMHTLFVREHNYWAETYAGMNPRARDEEIYQFARMIVAAEIQAITYREFLPVMLGRDALPPYRGYDSQVNPGISNEFGAAAFRIGHSMLSPDLLRIDSAGEEIAAGHLSLAASFFNPAHVESEGIDSVLRGLAAQQCQELDEKIIDEVRNFLFGAPGSGGFDLASLNIQRGRDHGLPGFNETRLGLGLSAIQNFEEITDDPEILSGLDSLGATPDDLDLWIASLCEDKEPGSMVGPTFHRILVDQFQRLRDGDRFYYRGAFDQTLIEIIERQTLAKIIRRNTEIGDELPDNVFVTGDKQEVRGRPVPSRVTRQNERRGQGGRSHSRQRNRR